MAAAPGMKTRLATLADLDALAPLFDAYRQFYEQAPDLDSAREFLRARMAAAESGLIVLEAGNELLGFCQLYPSFCSVLARPIFVLYDLFVSPSARRGGGASALLQAAVDLARQRGKARMDLTTARTNHQAQALYERMGWRLDEVFLAYQRELS